MPQEHYKGNVTLVVRQSDSGSQLAECIATIGEDEGAYDQKDAEGFIRLNALRMRIDARQKHKDRRKQ